MNIPVPQPKITMLDFIVPSVNMTSKGAEQNIKEALRTEAIDIALNYNEDIKDRYSIQFNIRLCNSQKEFDLEIQAIAVFTCDGEITQEFLQSHFVKTNSPAIAFPFVRSFIQTLTLNAGFSPIILQPFNFVGQRN